ncbi:hypothetical protein B0T40_16040 [Chromobacterium haemolyticum]|nr:hypothetical protein B0T40_16040 [Chromobacterium haemolyticum]
MFDTDTEMQLSQIGALLRSAGGKESIDSFGKSFLPLAIDGFDDFSSRNLECTDYWGNLKAEFMMLICTSNKKYADLRKKLASNADKSQTAIVSAIAAGMATQFGVVAGLLVPFVALCLVVLARTGKEAFCATVKWETPLGETLNPEPKKD